MRRRRARIMGTKSKIHIMTGGLKEDVSQLEMRGGDLIDCLNYQEVDGAFHGYRSISGYEIFDGTGLASETPVTYLNDYGNDRFTTLLLEAATGFVDIARESLTVTNTGVNLDTNNPKFTDSTYIFNGLADLTVGSSTFLDMEGGDFAIDLWVKPSQVFLETVLFEKEGSYKLTIEAGKLRAYLSADGVTYSTVVTSVNNVSAGVFSHVAFCRNGDDLHLFINGVEDSATEVFAVPVFTSVSDLIIGQGYIGNMEEFRVSKGTFRWFRSFDPPTTQYSNISYAYTQVDDTDREAIRSAITTPGGQGAIQGVAYYKDDVYALQNNVGAADASLHKSSGSGWSALSATLGPDGSGFFMKARYNALAGHQREEILFLTYGGGPAAYTDGSTFTEITHANLPDTPGYYPILCTQFKERLFLAYEDGRVVFSAVEDPTDFDPLNGAGEFFMEDAVKGMIVAPGDSLIVFCRNSTHIIKALSNVQGTSSAVVSDYKFSKEVYSRRSGARKLSAIRMLGNLYFLDDRGVTNLEATDAFGDFSANSISKNVQTTLFELKDMFTCAVPQREFNQYRLFFSNNVGLYFTFDVEKRLKGATKVQFNTPVSCVAEGETSSGEVVTFFGSTDGAVYKMDSGTSFNGEDIITRLRTTYYSYSTSTVRKHFKKATLEAQAEKGLLFYGTPDFDYRKVTTPRGDEQNLVSEGFGGRWGIDRWSLFSWGSSSVQDPVLYFTGFGKNLSMQIATSDKYRSPHVINSMTIEYSGGGRVM